MSAVFLMQPLGQLCAYSVGLAVLRGLSKPFGRFDLTRDDAKAKIGIDILWRIVAGVGGVPALIALIFRWTIPESGRYTCDIKRDSWKALVDTADGTTGFFSRWSSTEDLSQAEHDQQKLDGVEADAVDTVNRDDVEMRDYSGHIDFARPWQDLSRGQGANVPDHDHHQGAPPSQTQEAVKSGPGPVQQTSSSLNAAVNEQARATMAVSSPNTARAHDTSLRHADSVSAVQHNVVPGLDDDIRAWTQFSGEERRKYFYDGGNWRYLFGASACWFFLDVRKPPCLLTQYMLIAAFQFVFYGLGFNNPGRKPSVISMMLKMY